MNPKLVAFKTVRGRLTLTLGRGVWKDLLKELVTQLRDPVARNFFRGARVMLETSDTITIDQLETLLTTLSQHGITLVPPDGGMEISVAPDRASAPLSIQEGVVESLAFSSRAEKARLISGTVRAGQRIESKSSIVVIGNVNSGAELIAAGDVTVWGILRGAVSAGMPDNNEAIVLALVLEPTLLRIGGNAAAAVSRGEYRSRREH